jgi:ferric-dicitrate binding protein FerR (iron transport regulator)
MDLLDHREPDKRVETIARASGNERMTLQEKENLWERIEEGMARKNKIRYLHYAWKAAAVAALIAIPATYLLQRSSHPAILRYAEQTAVTMPDTLTNTRLVLPNHQQVQVSQPTAVITYQLGNTLIVNTQTLKQDDQPEGFNTLLVPYARTAELTLEDGTKVWLNAGSRLVYPSHFNTKERTVVLEGEGYFEVSHDAEHPFYVYAGDSKVQVLGTAFNIAAYREEMQQQVVLCSGSIALETGGEKALMIPGQLAQVRDGKQTGITAVDPGIHTAWKDHHLVAVHTTLNEILRRLSRYYNKKILINSTIGNETFSGDIDLKNNMEDVLKTIADATSMRHEYDVSGNIIFNKK